MQHTKKSLLKTDIIIALLIMPIVSFILIHFDFFDWWYHMTRDHESWELDEFASMFVAISFASNALLIHHLFRLLRTYDKLEDAQKNIEALNKIQIRQERLATLGRLSSDVAHEVGNALQPVLGKSGILKRVAKERDEEIYKMTEDLEAACMSVRRILENTLSFIRNNELNFQDYEAGMLVKESIDLASSILSHAITLEVNNRLDLITYADVRINCDRTSIAQAFLNLFKNSSDAMGGIGVIEVNIDSCVLDDADAEKLELPTGNYLKVSVRDDGPGINTDSQNHIFEPFYSEKKEGEGSGLGLPNTENIMKQHAGVIYLDKTIETGTCFHLLLPCSYIDKEALP